MRKLYAERRAAGVCVNGACRERAVPGGACCPTCTAARNEVTRKRKAALRAERRAAGLCYECGGPAAASYCPACKPKKKMPPAVCARIAARRRKKYAANKAAGVCVAKGCGGIAEPGRSYCPACLAAAVEVYRRSPNRPAWNRVGKCKRCGTPKLTRYCEACKPERA